MGKKLEIIEGMRFNHLVVLKEIERKNPKKRRFLCKCDCGNITEIDLASLKHRQKTCGCTNWLKKKLILVSILGKNMEC